MTASAPDWLPDLSPAASLPGLDEERAMHEAQPDPIGDAGRERQHDQRILDIHATITAVALAQAMAARLGLSTQAGVHRLTFAELVAVASYYGAEIEVLTVERTGEAFASAAFQVEGVDVCVFGAVAS